MLGYLDLMEKMKIREKIMEKNNSKEKEIKKFLEALKKLSDANVEIIDIDRKKVKTKVKTKVKNK